MIDTAMAYLGRERLEEMALNLHEPMQGRYVIVNEDGTYKTINEKRMRFNSKYCGMDFYSQLVSINKPICSKLISSNNYYAFFCRHTQKLHVRDIDDYYDALNLPPHLVWIREWIKMHIWDLGKADSRIVKVFFPGKREEYRELGIGYWKKASISLTKFDEEKGAPIGYVINPKKSYLRSGFNTYLVSEADGLCRKLFFDILKSINKMGYNIVYIWENGIYATNATQGPPEKVLPSTILFVTKIDAKGQLVITSMDMLPGYSPLLDNPKGNCIKKIREQKGMSRAELSRLSSIPIRTLEDWEYGKRQPRDIKKLRKIADILGVSLENLI